MAALSIVSQYIPTFEKVEAYNSQFQNSSYTDGEGTEESLQHSLVLTQPDTESVCSARSNKSDKMQKKLEYEAGIKSNRRILRTISKTFHLPPNPTSVREQSSSPKTQRPPRLSRTVSQHELNLENKAKQNQSTAHSRALQRKEALHTASVGLKTSNGISSSLKTSNGASKPQNIAALRAADRRSSIRSSSPTSIALKVADRKNSSASLQTVERTNSSSSLRGSAGIKRQNLRTTLAKTTAELNKNIAELAMSVDSPHSASPVFTSPRIAQRSVASPRLRTAVSVLSPKLRAPTAVLSPKTRAVSVLSPKIRASSVLSPKVRAVASTLSPIMESTTEQSSLKLSSGFQKPTKSSMLKQSSEIPRAALSPVNSPKLKSTRMPIGGKHDALNVLLHDFEAQNKRAVQLSQLEQQIFQQEVAKFEEMQERKQKQDEAAIILANNIKDRETRLANLFASLEGKKKRYQVSEEQLSAVSKEFSEEVRKAAEASGSGASSAAIRLQEAANRRELKDQWRSSTDPIGQARYQLLEAQEDIRSTEANIAALTKELGRMKNQAGKAKSSDNRIREEARLRDNMRRTGQVKERGTYVRPKGVPKSNEKSAFQTRLDEEKAKRIKAREEKAKLKANVARNPSVADLIAKQAGSSRMRYGVASPLRGASGTPQFVR